MNDTIKTRAAKPYEVHSQEEGRGPSTVVKFATLAEASAWIQERWQGPDYIDGASSWHTDYCSYTARGFILCDIGKYHTTDDGWREYSFTDFLLPLAQPVKVKKKRKVRKSLKNHCQECLTLLSKDVRASGQGGTCGRCQVRAAQMDVKAAKQKVKAARLVQQHSQQSLEEEGHKESPDRWRAVLAMLQLLYPEAGLTFGYVGEVGAGYGTAADLQFSYFTTVKDSGSRQPRARHSFYVGLLAALDKKDPVQLIPVLVNWLDFEVIPDLEA